MVFTTTTERREHIRRVAGCTAVLAAALVIGGAFVPVVFLQAPPCSPDAVACAGSMHVNWLQTILEPEAPPLFEFFSIVYLLVAWFFALVAGLCAILDGVHHGRPRWLLFVARCLLVVTTITCVAYGVTAVIQIATSVSSQVPSWWASWSLEPLGLLQPFGSLLIVVSAVALLMPIKTSTTN